MVNKKNVSLISNDTGFYKYLQEINNIPSLTMEEEFLLAKAYLEEHDLKAAQKLVTSHLKLVAKIAINYRNYGLPITELVSEGNLGLMQAIKKYNPDLGFRLSTYAMWWIKASIQEYILKSWSLVKIGTTAAQKKLFFSLNKIKNKITNMYSRMVTEQDFPQIARELGVSTSEVAEMNTRLAGADISLNSYISSEDSTTELLEFLPETRPTQEVSLINQQELRRKRKVLTQAMAILNDRELQILTERKLQDSPTTLDDLSIKYKISKERVRQIENKAFEKIQSFVLNQVTC
ncbi:RNA polymerase sigma factor RpoH [Candidatus Trichorickettsia mobilis]|uniref:RNA polymerase sigma factor n=1 Tax=Candidatus Trichorickettsia mobilis TaxID=1346319 RepID=A0ABZ0UT52_9RICK|nr:RNA polymerase sigma factor RpoH [Candidatus Trichorickettsia mobilis]WPY01220.1 RNA polymerase sigma factor RpoH [Candidatus Trichorickettsia mobilis]